MKEKGYKDTKVGEVPENWKVVKIDDIVSLEYGEGLPERKRTKGKYPVVGSNGIIGYHNEALVKGPGIIVGRKGAIGAVSLVTQDFWPIDTTYYVKTKTKDISLKWLYYEMSYLNFAKFYLADVIPGLKRDLVYPLRVLLPPLHEQRKIASILSTVDEAIQLADEAIAKTERLKRGLMQELLTKGIEHKEFKDTEIGRIPKSWKIVKLGKVLSLRNGQRPKISEDGSIPVYGANGVMGDTTEFLADNDFTVVIGRVGTSGEVYLGQGKIWVSDNAIYSENYNGSAIHPFFIYYLLKSKNLGRFASKTTHSIITQTFLNHFPIPLPPLHEQRKIASILSTVDEKLELEKQRKEKIRKIKKGLMHELLTGRGRVKIDEGGAIERAETG